MSNCKQMLHQKLCPLLRKVEVSLYMYMYRCTYTCVMLFPIIADLMSSQGAELIIAIDVGSEDNNDLLNYGDSISGWRIIINKLNPFTKKMKVNDNYNYTMYNFKITCT